jgi:sugar phosphate isomerase/epimerase
MFQYATPMDRYYPGNFIKDVKPNANIEQPIMPLQEIGQTITEGRQFGTFLQSATASMRTGVGKIELQPGMGGGEEPVGVESYGQEARQALRELARANKIEFTSVHTPPAIGNMSGYNPQQGGFSDDTRDHEVKEVREAIKFAAEATEGGAVVIHTGEYPRPFFDAPWNTREGKWKDSFKNYAEEHERAVKPLVDVRTGRVIQEVRMNQLVPRPVWNRYEEDNDEWQKHKGKSYIDENGNTVKPGDYIDYEGRVVDREGRMPKYNREKNEFLTRVETWDDIEKEAEELNRHRAKKLGINYEEFMKSGREDIVTAEEAFLYATTETQEAISRGWAGNYSERGRESFKYLEKLKKARDFYAKLESNIPEEEKWKLKGEFDRADFGGLVPKDVKMPVEYLDEQIRNMRESIASTKEMVTGQQEQALNQRILRENTVSAKKYAMKQTLKSYAEAGVEAMQQSHVNPFAKKDIFLAPENIFPEMGYGSHPEELIQLVKKSREEMTRYLSEPMIEDPSGKVDPETKKPVMVNNPYYKGLSKEEAEKEAKAHIKATFDTQHLGMWFADFEPLQGETRQDRKKRFDKWYLEQVEKMAKEDIIGNVHLVDAIGGGHQHLPAGQGDLPLKEAITILKKNGFKGSINSEAYGEERFGQGRILLETWREFGSNIYGSGGYGMSGMPSPAWSDVRNSYFGRSYPPYFIFGAYSPSNEWTLWSQVPME